MAVRADRAADCAERVADDRLPLWLPRVHRARRGRRLEALREVRELLVRNTEPVASASWGTDRRGTEVEGWGGAIARDGLLNMRPGGGPRDRPRCGAWCELESEGRRRHGEQGGQGPSACVPDDRARVWPLHSPRCRMPARPASGPASEPKLGSSIAAVARISQVRGIAAPQVGPTRGLL